MCSKEINLSILCLMNPAYFLSKESASKLKFLKMPFWQDYLILPNNLNMYRQKWISLINCFEISLIVSFFNSFLLAEFSISLFTFVVLKEIFSVFFDEGVFTFWKLNFVKSWFFGEVMLAFNLMFWDLASVKTFDGLGRKTYFLSSYGSNLLCFSIQRHFVKKSIVKDEKSSFLF